MSVKIGLFGGSFDPIHTGHLEPVREARAELGLDRVIFLPTARPPHKPGRQFAPAHARYAMVELALLSEEGLYASSYELTPGRPAYTIDTLEHFRSAEPEAELYLLIGGDSLAELPTWHRWRELAGLARLAVLVRPGREPLGADPPPELSRLASSDRVRFVTNRPVGVSSTELRSRLAAGREIPSGWVPPLVLEYLSKYSLYR